jgi:predicted glutamine amidotransferase
MCVIIVKDKNQTLPKKDTLKNCFERNPDGAGFMYVESGKVVIDKGYMTFKSFYKHYKKLCNKFNNFEGKNLVMHMRISTSGGVERENTHPFPITDNYQDMFKLYYRTDIGVMHNGVISASRPSKDEEAKKINDTMIFTKEYLNRVYEDWKDCFKNYAFITGVNILTSSKFAILDKDENLTLIGTFYEYEGAKYSNTSYYALYKGTNSSSPTKKYGYDYNKKYGCYNYDGYSQYGYYGDDYYYDEGFDYDDYYTSEEYEKYLEEKYGEVDDEDVVILQDNDLVALDEESDYVRVGNIRTEEGSIFIFETKNYVLKELSSVDRKVIKKYPQAYAYVEKTGMLY